MIIDQHPGETPCAIPLRYLGDLGSPTLAPTTGTHGAASGGPYAALPETTGRHGYALHDGNAEVPMVRIAPDANWPGMWRMIWPDGGISDMANLVRIKDAAAGICDRGPPRRDRRRFRWKADRPAALTERDVAHG